MRWRNPTSDADAGHLIALSMTTSGTMSFRTRTRAKGHALAFALLWAKCRGTSIDRSVKMVLTRRHFLSRAAAAGGASLLYEAMTGLGLLAAPAQTRFELSGRISNVRVLILGGGLARLTTADELGQVG